MTTEPGPLLIRREAARDTEVIRTITAAAFARDARDGAEPAEARLVDELRASTAASAAR